MEIDKLIWINGMPRSGTSWLSQIFDSHPNVNFKLSPLFSYEFKNYVNENSTKNEWVAFFQKVFDSKDEFINQTYRRVSGEYPIFKKNSLEHLVIKDTRYHHLTDNLLLFFPNIKFVHIIRNPCGAINSWLKAPNEFPKNVNYLDEWRTGKSRKNAKEEFWGFNDWLLLTKKYIKLENDYPNQVKIIFYEALVNEPILKTKELFDFVNLDLTSQTLTFLDDSQKNHNNSEYAVYKNTNVVDQWKKELDSFIITEIKNELEKHKLDIYFNI